jgi:hypothetical protein
VWNPSAHVRSVSRQWNDLVKRIFFVFQVSDSVPQHIPAGDMTHLPVIAVSALRFHCVLIANIVSFAWVLEVDSEFLDIQPAEED